MQTISKIISNYKDKIDYLDIELIIAHSLGKTREFVLMSPEFEITSHQSTVISQLLRRRIQSEPIAHILGHKEFYGLDFIVNKYTLVPRPETEMMVEDVRALLRSMLRNNVTIIDVGTGSGCIVVSITHELQKNNTTNCHPELRAMPHGCRVSGSRDASAPSEMLKQVQHDKIKYYAIDISTRALKIAKKNARLNGVEKKINFLQGNLLSPFLQANYYNRHSGFLQKARMSSLIITANLPYLSKEIYNSAPVDVKKYEPKSALYSAKDGLDHYERLLKQIEKISIKHQASSITCLLEISPEQKVPITKLIKSILPCAKIEFSKDLAGKWRLCKINV